MDFFSYVSLTFYIFYLYLEDSVIVGGADTNNLIIRRDDIMNAKNELIKFLELRISELEKRITELEKTAPPHGTPQVTPQGKRLLKK